MRDQIEVTELKILIKIIKQGIFTISSSTPAKKYQRLKVSIFL